MPVFRVERNKGYTVMSNYHLRNKSLSLKAKSLLSQILSLPEDWDYTLSGLCYINRESKGAIRSAVNELERAGYIERHQTTDEGGKFSSNESTSSTNSLFLCRRRWINRRRKTRQRENRRRKIQRN